MATITLSDKMPELPEHDFAFEINFVRGTASPSRVFLATHEFIKFCEKLDSALLETIDSSINPLLLLEDIESGSIKTWLKYGLSSVDDSALKNLDWKPLVGKYLVKAKYIIIQWLDRSEENYQPMSSLIDSVKTLAEETNVRHLGDYPRLHPETIINAAKNLQTVKDHLNKDDQAKFVFQEGEISINLNFRIPIESIESLAVAMTITQPPVQLILPVKRPDYLTESKWEMRHGRHNISAKIDDLEWLKRFHAREFDLRPGDALDCMVEIENSYDDENELISEKFRITKINKILPKRMTMKLPFVEDDQSEQ